MEKQSALEWLQSGLELIMSHEEQMQAIGLFEQAKEMEKEQIVEAFYQGVDQESDTHGVMILDRKDAENYYNEIFKTK